MQKKETDILILGAGIGGLAAFRKLHKLLRSHNLKKKITVIDRNNYFTYTPMLHEVASGSVQPNQCAIPIRELIYKTGHSFQQAEVEQIDAEKKIVKTSESEITYKYCILALGSKTNFFGIKGAEKYSEHVRSLPAAVNLHQKFIHLLENHSPGKIKMVIVGGGATGVEMAGQFCHFAKHEIKDLYPEKSLEIIVVQAQEVLMNYNSKNIQEKVTEKLKKEKVKVMLNAVVAEVTENEVILVGGEKISSDITIWAAGFENTAIKYLDEKYLEKGQVKVNEFLQVEDEPSLYAVGDIALVKDPQKDFVYPKLAQVAQLEGKYVARQILASLKNSQIKPFNYKLKGNLIPIGDWYAIAEIGPLHFEGWLAWWIRRTVYLMCIPGFLRKTRIVLDWTLHSLGFRHIVDINLNRKL